MPVRSRSRCSSEAIHSRASRADRLSSRELRVPALADQAALPQGERRLVLERLVEQLLSAGGAVMSSASVGEERRRRALRGPPAGRAARPRKPRSPTRSRAWADAEGGAAGEPLEVADAAQARGRRPRGAAGSATSAPTASWRRRMASRSSSGRRSHWRSRRAPIGVRVRSSVAKSEPRLDPLLARSRTARAWRRRSDRAASRRRARGAGCA